MNASDELKRFVRRIENLDEEIGALNADKSAVYAEAKSRGFDVPIMKKLIGERRLIAKKGEHAVIEASETLDVYRNALAERGTPIATRAHVREAASPPLAAPALPASASPPPTSGDSSAAAVAADPDSVCAKMAHTAEIDGGVEGHAAATEAREYSEVRPNASAIIPDGRVDAADGGRDGVRDLAQPVFKPGPSIPSPTAAAIFNRARPARDSRFEYAQPAPDDDLKIPTFLQRAKH